MKNEKVMKMEKKLKNMKVKDLINLLNDCGCYNSISNEIEYFCKDIYRNCEINNCENDYENCMKNIIEISKENNK